MNDVSAVKYEQEIPDVLKAMGSIHAAVDVDRFDCHLRHLGLLRASQINGCAHCIKMHAREARQDGETEDRLDRLVAWRHMSDFSAREKAAFAWTEALTVIEPSTDYGLLRANLREHFSDREIGLLTTLVGLINFWNRLQVSRH